MLPKYLIAFVIGFYCIILKCGTGVGRSMKTKHCHESVGLQSGDVDDDDIHVSSKRKHFDILDAWCPSRINKRQYFQVNLRDKTKITKVSTQGRLGNVDRHVKSYRLYYSMDGKQWEVYKVDGTDKIFKGNHNSYGVMDHELHPPIVAKLVRINPTSWKNDICLRVELYGCDA